MFHSVMVANRGEIAVRVTRTLRRMGIRSVAVYSDADAGARHVLEADVAERLGPAPAAESYLSIERVVAAAVRAGADAVHPGYGFLAENAAFARACARAGLVFVGPPAEAIEVMGDKIRAKQAVGRAGVPVVPGRAEAGLTDAGLLAAAGDIGFPVVVKPSAGGGGKGMHVAADADELAVALPRARREAAAAFGDDTVFLERFVTNPRHIEVQVLADGSGRTVHLGERECSLQRRHQKVVEEAPSVLLDAGTRRRIGASACATAAAVGYRGAGTVEFIVGADRPDEFFFMEMNTRLQVEHPVTEMVTGLDLVEHQLRVAAGEPLSFAQSDVTVTGHAVEARVYAEDPARGFLPTGGTVLAVREPWGDGVRVDSGLAAGMTVGTAYDPMLAKVVAWGETRATALARLDRALAETAVLGVGTNIGFLRSLLGHPDVVAGRLDTGLIERHPELAAEGPVPDLVYAAYGLLRLAAMSGPPPSAPAHPADPWDQPTGWSLRGPRPAHFRVTTVGGAALDVAVTSGPSGTMVRVGSGPDEPARILSAGDHHVMEHAGVSAALDAAPAGDGFWIGVDGRSWYLREPPPLRRGAVSEQESEVTSPMPGTVIGLAASTGDTVRAGQAVLVLEAMKMEHTLTSPGPGTVEILVAAGAQVTLGQVLALVHADDEPPPLAGD